MNISLFSSAVPVDFVIHVNSLDDLDISQSWFYERQKAVRREALILFQSLSSPILLLKLLFLKSYKICVRTISEVHQSPRR